MMERLYLMLYMVTFCAAIVMVCHANWVGFIFAICVTITNLIEIIKIRNEQSRDNPAGSS